GGCTAQDEGDVAGTCDRATGSCSSPAKADGRSCNDGDLCTQGDTCQAGTCTGNPVVCTAQDQCHVAGTCDPATGLCSNPAKADGTGCNDGDLCTQGDTCQAGTCAGHPGVTSPAEDHCLGGSACKPRSGLSSNP